jgi:hypothetical protein
LHGARGGDFRYPKLIARMSGQGIFRHKLLSNLPRNRLIDTALDVDFGKLCKLSLNPPWVMAKCVPSVPKVIIELPLGIPPTPQP